MKINKKIKIFITGGSGFISQHLIKRLLKNPFYEIILLQSTKSNKNFNLNKNVKYYFYDKKKFNLYSCLLKERPNLVINSAGCFISEHQKKDLETLIKSNVIFGIRLLEAMKEAGIKNIINTGSYWEQYYQDGTYHPVNLYASFKKAFQDILQYYVEVHDFRAITLRLYDVYGPNDKRKKIMPLLQAHIGSNRILNMSPGKQYIDFIYIDDVVNSYIKAINFIFKNNVPINEHVDVGSGKSIQLVKFVSLFEKIYNKKIKVNFGGRSYRKREIMKAKANIRKTKKILHWQPKVTIKQGLNKIKNS